MDRLSIFVPAVMAGGLLFSLVILLRDALERTFGQRRILRRGALFGHTTAAGVLPGTREGTLDVAGLRPRALYATVGLICCGIAAYGLPGAVFNYLHAGFYNADIAWMLAWCLLAVLVFAAIGGTSLAIAARYRNVPIWTLPLLFSTPLSQVTLTADGARPGAPPEEPELPGRWPSRRAGAADPAGRVGVGSGRDRGVPRARRRGRSPAHPCGRDHGPGHRGAAAARPARPPRRRNAHRLEARGDRAGDDGGGGHRTRLPRFR